ncbi:deoxyribonuclease-1-like [Gymnodraco acuticeps]|uniref:Deoxyribonuclease n=1 Tax=Gymnodraco acuticeps TaxID=8218 RepID=A0A6P8WB25_GYMAC|nr:deoxyribonuclease-1-like [Gymnodraco acuticeps]
MRSALCSGSLLALLHVTPCLWIGAFNIEDFGPKKSKDDFVMNHIQRELHFLQIVLRYDIILIQGLQDKDLSVTKRLKDLVNKDSQHFSNILSEPLPLSSSILKFWTDKERYLFLYRDKKVTVKDSFQYTAKGFDRPPYVVKFSSTETGKEFVLIPIHTKPDHAVKEIDALVDVVAAAGKKWNNNKNIMVLGDFNAGSRYVKVKKRNKKNDWDDIPLFTNKDFHWLINDNVATKVDSQQAHDRIVVTTEMEKGVVEGSAKVFNFRKKYDLNQAERILFE